MTQLVDTSIQQGNSTLNLRKIATFLLLTFGVDWAIAIGYLSSGH